MKMSVHLQQVEKTLRTLPLQDILAAIEIIKNTKAYHQVIWIVGNGGSASTAMHFANDLTKMCGMNVVCLPSEIPTILAYGNDSGWENMFAGAMDNFHPSDVLVAISCSGASKNVVTAAKRAHSGMGKVIGLTGPIHSENYISRIAHVTIVVDNPNMPVQEDIHLAICHAIAGEVRDDLQGL